MISEKELENHQTIFHIKDLKSNLQNLQKCDALTFDFSNATSLTDENLQYVSEIISELTTIKSLSFELKNCTRITDTGISKLSTAIAEIEGLEFLKLNLEGCKELTTHSVSTLIQPDSRNYCVATRDRKTVISGAISGPDTLKRLWLSFKGLEKIDDAGFTGLAHAIASQPTITDLYLDFSDCTNLTNVGSVEIFKTLPLLTELECLSLFIDGPMEITEDGLTILNESLAQLRTLFSLQLGISRNRYVSNSLLSEEGDESGLFGLFACFAKREKLHEYGLGKALSSISIRELDLNCFNEHITDTGVLKLNSSLSKIDSLRKIRMNFTSPWRVKDDSIRDYIDTIGKVSSMTHIGINLSKRENIGDKEGTLVAQKLEGMTSIKSLNFNYQYCSNISDETLIALSKAISDKKVLQELICDFQGTKVTSKGLEALVKSLILCEKLEILKLSFGYTAVNDFSAKAFVGVLEYLRGLKTLEVNFKNCQLSDSGLSSFGNALKKLQKLENLVIDLDGNSGVSDDFFNELGVNLPSLSELKIFSVYASSSNISDNGLKKLTNGFKDLKKLNKFVISLEKCVRILDSGIESLSENIADAPALARFTLNIDGCRFITSIEKSLATYTSHKSLAQVEIKVSRDWKVDLVEQWGKKLEESLLLRGSVGPELLNK